MKTNGHRIGFWLAPILACAMMGLGAATGFAAKADSGAKRGGARPDKKGKKRKARRPKASRSVPVPIPKPVWNQKAGFGLPVPPGWSGKVEGPKIILTLSDPPEKHTTIAMGPEPTELDASEYLGKICKELASGR